MGAEKVLMFGWRSNSGADGFEQDHGRYVMEVFWNESARKWEWVIWSGAMIVAQNESPSLAEAKKAVLRSAAHLEREAIKEDKKFR